MDMSNRFLKYYAIIFPLVMIIGSVILYKLIPTDDPPTKLAGEEVWHAPNIRWLPVTPETEQLRYGRDLIANTSAYFGPKGSIAKISNGMECQNCHIDAGTRPYGNSFGAVASTYPKYRDRSGKMETIEFRINECMERSMNGKPIDTFGREMKAMVAYFKWLGKDVPKGVSPPGTGVGKIPFLHRAADPARGSNIYKAVCQTCH